MGVTLHQVLAAAREYRRLWQNDDPEEGASDEGWDPARKCAVEHS